jgi:hypothetical protein
MNSRTRHLSVILAGSAMFTALLLGGCSNTTEETVYDPGHSDYHKWDSAEAAHYQQWVTETHHANVDYKKLPPDDQKSYWDWRHGQH